MSVRLERFYPGDEAWGRFALAVPEELESFSDKQELQSILLGDRQLANVIYGCIGDEAVRWTNSPNDMLDGLSPAACISQPDLLRRLRTMLMRMH